MSEKRFQGKVRRYQVVYRALGADGKGIGEVLVVCLEGESVEGVRRIFGGGFLVLDVLELGVALDPNQCVYDREEAAVFLRCSTSHIDSLVKANVLPKSVKGFPMFHRSHLDRVWKERMQYEEPKAMGRAA